MRGRPDHVGEKGFGAAIAVEDAVLGAFLVVDDELDRDARTAGPAGIGRRRTIADEIAVHRVASHAASAAGTASPA